MADREAGASSSERAVSPVSHGGGSTAARVITTEPFSTASYIGPEHPSGRAANRRRAARGIAEGDRLHLWSTQNRDAAAARSPQHRLDAQVSAACFSLDAATRRRAVFVSHRASSGRRSVLSAHTGDRVRDLVRANIDRSPCSTDRSRHRPALLPFARGQDHSLPDKERHQIFSSRRLESREIYVNGFSMSLRARCRRIWFTRFPVSNAVLLRPVMPSNTTSSTDGIDAEARDEAGVSAVLAGQINGTSGYEEAAAQGIVAGINAAGLSAATRLSCSATTRIGILVDD